MKFIKINPLFYFVLISSFLIGIGKDYLSMFFILLFHECGHLLAVFFEDIKIFYIKIEPFGITIKIKDNLIKSRKKEFLIAIAGPLANFLLFFILYLLKNKNSTFIMYSSLCMGIFNLIPAIPLDGGRILKTILLNKYGYLKSYNYVLCLTRILSYLMIISGIFIIFKTRFNFSFLIVGCFLLFNILTEKNQSYFYLIKEISEYKNKNKDIEKIPIMTIGINKDFYVRKILCDLTFNRFYIFNVIENGKIICHFTESELIDSIIKFGSHIRIKDII